MEKSANEDGKSKSTRSFFPIYGKTKQSVLSISFDSFAFYKDKCIGPRRPIYSKLQF
jgi:hypothetical protein